MKTRNPWSLLFCICALVFLFVSTAPAEDTIFSNENPSAVMRSPSAPPSPTQFTLKTQSRITYLRTYHWNNGNGQDPGTITLKNLNTGKQFSFQATSYNKYYWVVKPSYCYRAGTYQIAVSSPSTWSYNSQSGSKGFATVNADPIPTPEPGEKGPVCE
jgi:hypothetical protein